MKVVLDHIEDLAPNIKTFWFKPEEPMRYQAGQFTQIRLPHKDEDDRGDKRWFTVSSAPTQRLVSISTKYAADKSSSFKKVLFGLKPGFKVNLADTMGDFILPKDPTIRLLFVAGGMGITPFHSMIKYLHDSGEKRDITLLYGANQKSEIVFKDTFQNYLGDKFLPVIGHGQLTTDKILELFNKTKAGRLYLSGPEPMVEVFDKQLKDKGVPPENLQTDFFPGYKPF